MGTLKVLEFWTSPLPSGQPQQSLFLQKHLGHRGQGGPGKEFQFPTLRLPAAPRAQGNGAKMWGFGQELLPWAVPSVRRDPSQKGHFSR